MNTIYGTISEHNLNRNRDYVITRRKFYFCNVFGKFVHNLVCKDLLCFPEIIISVVSRDTFCRFRYSFW